MDYTAFLTPSIGAVGLLALVVLMIFRGSLIPKSTIDARIADKDAQIEMWRAAYEKSQEALDLKDQQIDALLEAARTTTNVVAAVSEAASRNSGRSRRALAPSEE